MIGHAWISGKDVIGVVIVKDEHTAERKGYIGVVTGANEEADLNWVRTYGTKIPIAIAEAIVSDSGVWAEGEEPAVKEPATLSSVLDFQSETLAGAILKESADEKLKALHAAAVEHLSPILQNYLQGMEVKEKYAECKTQEEVENYNISFIPESFRRELAAFLDKEGMPVHQSIFVYDLLLGQYYESAFRYVQPYALARIREILSAPKLSLP